MVYLDVPCRWVPFARQCLWDEAKPWKWIWKIQPCVGDTRPRLPPEYESKRYRSSTAKRKIQVSWLTDRAQWVTVHRPMDAASELFVAAGSSLRKEHLWLNSMVNTIPERRAGPCRQRGAADEWMNGNEEENGGSIVTAAGVHWRVTCTWNWLLSAPGSAS